MTARQWGNSHLKSLKAPSCSYVDIYLSYDQNYPFQTRNNTSISIIIAIETD